MSRVTYAEIKDHATYNSATGEFHRIHPSPYFKGKLGLVTGDSKSISINGVTVTKNCLAYLLMHKEYPQGNILHKDLDPDNYEWDNLIMARVNDTDVIKEKIRGRWLEVDNSTPTKPKTLADKLRRKGYCAECKWYIDRCLENNMTLNCLQGYEL